mmetsp:Transcript_10722/g.25553  ORF Transcript_10722/g.25553 Transcript_10722/m.25553 type:complete len:181 (+) Transcript_10722:53-595(+)
MSSSKYNSSSRRSSSCGRRLHRHFPQGAAGAAARSLMSPFLLLLLSVTAFVFFVSVVVVNGQDPLTSCPYMLTQDGGDCVVAQRGCCPNSLVEGTCLADGTDCPTSQFDCVWTSETRSAVCNAYNITTDGESIVNYNEPRGYEPPSSAMGTTTTRIIISRPTVLVVVGTTVMSLVAILLA